MNKKGSELSGATVVLLPENPSKSCAFVGQYRLFGTHKRIIEVSSYPIFCSEGIILMIPANGPAEETTRNIIAPHMVSYMKDMYDRRSSLPYTFSAMYRSLTIFIQKTWKRPQ